MNKEIKSKQKVTLIKEAGPVQIKTTLDHLKTYYDKITKENVYLKTDENLPFDFYIKTEEKQNKGFVQLTEEIEEYTIEKDTVLGHLVDIDEEQLTRIQENLQATAEKKSETKAPVRRKKVRIFRPATGK